MRAESLANPTSESVEAFVTEIARQRTQLTENRSFDSIRDFVREFGLHRVAPKQVVVGGTNGKGSTVRYLQQILSHQGLRVGTTTSPHLYSYLERMTLDGAQVEAGQCLDAIQMIAETACDIPLTYFDLTTLAALNLFKQWQVDVAVVEVGLGGRLDCANVVDSDVAVITNVDIDHSAVLGDTIEAISREKVPIARTTKPLIFADERVNLIVEKYVKDNDIPLIRFGREFGILDERSAFVAEGSEIRSIPIPVSVDYAIESFIAALQVAAMMDHLPSNDQLDTMRFPALEGRLEHQFTRDRHWVLDVAHNPAAITYLRRALTRQNFTACVVVFACFSDKDVRGMLKSLMEHVDPNEAEVVGIVITDSHGQRALSAASVRRQMTTCDCPIQVEMNVDDALIAASNLVTDKDVPIVVLGSFDVVSRARSSLNFPVMKNNDP